MNLSSKRLSWPNPFVFPQSISTNGDERFLSFRVIETSGNNWINVKRDKSVDSYRGTDLSKRGSYGEGVKNMLWGTAGERRRSIRGEQQRGEEGEEREYA